MKILIIDDQPAKSEFLATAIRDIGLQSEISLASNARDGYSLLQQGSFNLVLLDVVLPLAFGDEASENGSLWFIREVHRKFTASKMPLIVGTTQYVDSLAKVEDVFREQLWSIIYIADINPLWKKQLLQAIRFAQSNAPSVTMSACNNQEPIDIALVTALRIPEFSELVVALGGGDPLHLSETNETWMACKLIRFDGQEKSVIAACADDMGMTAMTSLVTRLSITFKPRVLMLTGIMGGNSERVGLSDLVCIEESWDCRAGKITSEGLRADVKSRTCNYKLANKFTSIISEDFAADFWKTWSGEKPDRVAKIHRGAVACSPAVIADGTVFEQLELQKRKILGVEMEAYGCYDATHRLGSVSPEVLSLKSVCDLGDSAKNDKYQRYCAALSATAAIRLLRDVRFS